VLGALVNHRRYLRGLPEEDRPQPALPWLTTGMAAGTALAGIALAVYLALT
jgi:hypothetical protein